MGEVRTAARDFPFQGLAHCVSVKSQEPQALGAGKMLGGGLGGPGGGGEVNETIAQVDGGAKGLALGLEGRPFVGAKDFIDQHGVLMPCKDPGIKSEATIRLFVCLSARLG